MQERVREDDVEPVGAGWVRIEGLEGVNAPGDLVVPLLVDGQGGRHRERQVQRMDGEFLAATEKAQTSSVT